MKNLLVLFALLLVGMPAYAQGADMGGSGTAVFFAIIVIAAAVLQIILFFKVWMMTNDVSRLKEMMEEEKEKSIDYNVEIKTFFFSGNVKSAKELIYRKFFNSINQLGTGDVITNAKEELKKDLYIIGETVPDVISTAFFYGDIMSLFTQYEGLKPYSLVRRNADGVLMNIRFVGSDGTYKCAINGVVEGDYKAEEITKVELTSIK